MWVRARSAVLLGLVLVVAVLAAPANGAAAKLNGACPSVGKTATSGKTKLVCTKVGSKKIWKIAPKTQPKPAATPAPTPTPTPSPTQQQPVVGLLCPTVGERQRTANGVEVVCLAGQDGKSAWREAVQPTPTPTPTQAAIVGWICPVPGERSKTSAGIDVVCTVGQDGRSAWGIPQPIPTPTPTATPTPTPTATPTPSPTATPTPSPTAPVNALPKLWFESFDPLPESAKVYSATLGAACPQEGIRAYIDELWGTYVCAVAPVTRQLVWQKTQAATLSAGAETYGIYAGEPCTKDGETRGAQGGTFICTRPNPSSPLEWAYAGTPAIFDDWPHIQAPSECGPRLGIGSGEYYRIYKNSFAIDPRNPKVVWAIVEKIGVFLSTDGAATWKHITIPQYTSGLLTPDEKTCMGSPHIVFGQGTDTNTYFGNAGGPGNFTANKWIASMGQGAGLYITPDTGNTWRAVVPKEVNAFVYGFAVDPKNANVWYWGHGTESGSFMRSDGTRGYKPSEMTWLKSGFIEKTTDGGKTWTQLPTGLDWPQVRISWMHVSRIDSNTVTVGLFQRDTGVVYSEAERAPLIIRSTDGGMTWSSILKVGAEFGTAQSMTFNISDDEQQLIACTFKEVTIDSCWVSKNGGTSFAQVKQRLKLLTRNPKNQQELIGYGTVSYMSPENKDGIYRSRDGGVTWTRVTDAPATLRMDGGQPPELTEPEGLFWSPDGSVFLTGGAGLIYVSRDSGQSWTRLTTWEDFKRIKG